MHELSIARTIVREVTAFGRRNPGTRVRAVRVRVGALRAIDPVSLRYCYEASAIGTPAEGSRLSVDIVPIEATCRACRTRFTVESLVFICPKCGGAECDTAGGEELLLDWVELDEPAAPVLPRTLVRSARERSQSAHRSQP